MKNQLVFKLDTSWVKWKEKYYADLQSGEEQGLYDHVQYTSEGWTAEPESKGIAVVYMIINEDFQLTSE